MKANQYRQLYCAYGVCLQSSSGSEISKDLCLDNFHYMTCKYIVGEIFQFFPTAQFFKEFAKQMQAMLTNPVSILFGIVDWFQLCDDVTNDVAKHVCKAYKNAREVTQMASKMKNYYDRFGRAFDIKTDYCSQLDKLVEE